VNKIIIFFFSLFFLFILFCSCNNKNNIPSNYKISYVQSSQASTAVSNNVSSNISSKLSANSIFSSMSSKTVYSSKNNYSYFIQYSGISSNKSSNISPSSQTSQSSQASHSSHISQSSQASHSSHISQSSQASHSSNTSQSSQMSQTSSAVKYTVKDAVNLYNSAVNNTLSQNYICYNFSNTMNGGKAIQQSGNIVLNNANGKDVFLKKSTDGNTYYCDGNTVFIQKINKTGVKSFINLSYTHNDYYIYINLLMYLLDNSNIKSFDVSINADTTNINFVCTNYSDYSKITDIFRFDSAKTSINKITLTIQIKGDVLTNYTQQYDITFNGTQSKCIIDNSYYSATKGYVLTVPNYVKSVK
jgi:hypothetical protein